MTAVVFIGPHGAGKTTLGTRVAARLGLRFDGEIGRVVRERALAADPGRHAMDPDAAFDRRVMAGELRRDDARIGARVVESWHPVNLAYAAARSPAVYDAYRAALSERALDAIVVPLRLDAAAARARLSEPGPDGLIAFFASVAERAEREARALGLRLTAPVHTSRCTVDEAVDAALAAIASAADTRDLQRRALSGRRGPGVSAA